MFLPARIALAFLTIVPVRLPADLSTDDIRRSAAFFPLAGWLLGLSLSLGAWLFLRLGIPSLLTAALLTALGAWLTRGLHLDGLADLFDGLGGGKNPEERLKIMKDPAIGAFGVLGLSLLLIVKVAALTALIETGKDVFFTLLAASATSRWAMAALAWGGRYPRVNGTGLAFIGKLGNGSLILSALWLAPAFVWDWQTALLICGAALAPALWLSLKASRLLGGITGDVLGAACELGEACAWLAMTAR